MLNADKIYGVNPMSLPTCQNCNNQWTWKMTFLQLLRFKRELTCPYCGKAQYQSKDSLWKMNFTGIGPYILLPILFGLSIPLPVIISYSVIIILLFFLISPYLMGLSNEEEPIF
ncbi:MULTISPECIES: TIGR04104 family putative zinc finger protein [Allobacillus]|nr:hypothetical protein FPQ10_06890 [Allobacillus sp. SKP2-8]